MTGKVCSLCCVSRVTLECACLCSCGKRKSSNAPQILSTCHKATATLRQHAAFSIKNICVRVFTNSAARLSCFIKSFLKNFKFGKLYVSFCNLLLIVEQLFHIIGSVLLNYKKKKIDSKNKKNPNVNSMKPPPTKESVPMKTVGRAFCELSNDNSDTVSGRICCRWTS